MSQILHFSELLVTKFCHDISGQISAVGNGLEFFKEEQEDIKERALELVYSSSAELINRVTFYRYAYGSIKHDGEADIEYVNNLLQKFFNSSKIKVIWFQNADTCLNGITNRACKLIVNLTIIVASYLIHGGFIEIRIEKGTTGKVIKVTGRGRDFRINESSKAILIEHDQTDLKLNNVQYYHTAKIASELEVALKMEYDSNAVTFSAELSS
jgi:histidine phosphotransferase ChpT